MPDSDLTADAILKKHVKWLMLDCRGNKSEVARVLDWSRGKLERHLRRWGRDASKQARMMAPEHTAVAP